MVGISFPQSCEGTAKALLSGQTREKVLSCEMVSRKRSWSELSRKAHAYPAGETADTRA